MLQQRCGKREQGERHWMEELDACTAQSSVSNEKQALRSSHLFDATLQPPLCGRSLPMPPSARVTATGECAAWCAWEPPMRGRRESSSFMSVWTASRAGGDVVVGGRLALRQCAQLARAVSALVLASARAATPRSDGAARLESGRGRTSGTAAAARGAEGEGRGTSPHDESRGNPEQRASEGQGWSAAAAVLLSSSLACAAADG